MAKFIKIRLYVVNGIEGAGFVFFEEIGVPNHVIANGVFRLTAGGIKKALKKNIKLTFDAIVHPDSEPFTFRNNLQDPYKFYCVEKRSNLLMLTLNRK